MRPLVLLTALGLLEVGAARADDSAAGSIGAELSVDNDTLVVDGVDPGGRAEKAGLKAGDVIIKINDLVVKEKGLTAKEVEAAGNAKHQPGDKIEPTVRNRRQVVRARPEEVAGNTEPCDKIGSGYPGPNEPS